MTQVTLKTRGRLRPSLLRPAFLFGAHKKGSRQAGRRESPLSCGLQTKLICILCDTGRKVSYTFPSCVPVDFPSSDANSAHSPLAEFCAPCVPSGTGGTLLSQPSHKTAQGPDSPPGGLFWPVSSPGGGTTRLSLDRGRFGPHRGEFGRSHRRSRKASFLLLLLSGWKQNTP